MAANELKQNLQSEVQSDNCAICAEEYSNNELNSIVVSSSKMTNYKICSICKDSTDPANDFLEVKNILKAFFTIK